MCPLYRKHVWVVTRIVNVIVRRTVDFWVTVGVGDGDGPSNGTIGVAAADIAGAVAEHFPGPARIVRQSGTLIRWIPQASTFRGSMTLHSYGRGDHPATHTQYTRYSHPSATQAFQQLWRPIIALKRRRRNKQVLIPDSHPNISD